MAGACPSSQLLVQFAQGAADEFSAASIAQHVAECPQCSVVVESLKQAQNPAPAPRSAKPKPTAKPARLSEKQPSEPRRKKVQKKRRSNPETPQQKSTAPKQKSPAQRPAPKPASPPASSSQPDASPADSPTGEAPPRGKGRLLGGLAAAAVALAAIVGVTGHQLGWFGGTEQPDVTESDPSGIPSQPLTDPNQQPTSVEDLISSNAANRVGFKMGEFDPSEAVQNIKVTIKVAENGDALLEGLDLHLGLGFPLRLYPVGTDAREPAFAAFPQVSSLQPGNNVINPGESATFEYMAVPDDPGLDELRTTPELLDDVTMADLRTIGFASKGETDWMLEGYSIEVNGKLFASNDSADVNVGEAQEVNRTELERLSPAHNALATEVSELQAYIDTGFATDSDKEQLKAKNDELDASVGPISEAAGRVAGSIPWFNETHEDFKPAPATGPVAEEVKITLVTGTEDNAGTTNPVYLKVAGQKHLLTSELDFLVDEPGEQHFLFTKADLQSAPITTASLRNFEIGAVGNDRRFDAVPDRAKLQRVIVEADGQPVFDSEKQPIDRRTLDSIWLIPPAHRDDTGTPVENEETNFLRHRWTPGMSVETAVAAADANDSEGTDAAVPDDPTDADDSKKDPEADPEDGFGESIAVPPPIKPEPTPLVPTQNPFVSNDSSLPAPQLAVDKGKLQLERDKLALERQKLIQQAFSGGNPFSGSRRLRPFGRRASPLQQILTALTRPRSIVPRPITPRPSPRPSIATIRDVQILQPGLYQDQDRLTVQWNVDGDTSKIFRYVVTLHAVSPHLGALGRLQGVVASGSRAESRGATAGVRTVHLPALSLTNALSGSALMHCFLQPRVQAFDATNAPLSTTPTVSGSLYPVVRKLGANTRPLPLQLGPAGPGAPFLSLPAVGIAGSQAPGFQIAGDGYGMYNLGPAPFPAFDVWLSPTAVDFTTGEPSATSPNRGKEAWFLHGKNLLGKATANSHTFSFARYSNNIGTTSWPNATPASPVGHMNAGSKHITIRYEAHNCNLSAKQDLHFVAHAGFIHFNSGARPLSSTATITARVQVYAPPPTGLPFIPPPTPTNADIAGQGPRPNELMRFVTTTPIQLNKATMAGKLQLIDIPLLLFNSSLTRYDSLPFTFDTGTAAAQAAGSAVNNRVQTMTDLATRNGNTSTNNNGVSIYVTLIIAQTAPSTGGDGVGIFGARLAPKS